ncbi:MAG: hypothetical protein ACRD0H_05160, partial [Actinomycetes bacterium]
VIPKQRPHPQARYCAHQSYSGPKGTEVAMDWWVWVIIVLVALVTLTTLAAVVQHRRRRGGVIGLDDTGRDESP